MPTTKTTTAFQNAPELLSALRDNLSPAAIAIIASYLQPACSRDPVANREVTWFMENLFGMLGKEADALRNHLGV